VRFRSRPFFSLLGLLLCASLDASAACARYTLAFYELGVLYYRGADGKRQGIDKDIVDELARRSGCPFNTVLESRVRIWDQLSRHALDLSVSGIATAQREEFAEFVPYFQTRNFALLRRTLLPALATPESFVKQGQSQVAAVKSFKHGALYDAWLAELRAKNRVVDVADFDQGVRLFRAGRVDALIALPTSWALLLHDPGLAQQFQVMDWAPQDQLVHGLIMSRQRVSAEDRERLRQALNTMISDGTVKSIFSRHVGETLAAGMLLAQPAPRRAGP
jgi:polar amino acid transport system substrate-binding protein